MPLAAKARHPARGAGDADPETLGRRVARHAAVHHCHHNAFAKIVGKRHSRHLLRAAVIFRQNKEIRESLPRFNSLGAAQEELLVGSAFHDASGLVEVVVLR